MMTISRYQVEDTPIGSGGMGRVYRGIDPEYNRQVAIKEILPEFASDFEIRTRTEREVELLQQLDNDSIVKVYDQFPLNGNFYIVMEYVDGLNVEQYVQQYGAIPYERAARIMNKILEAMQFVHEKNFVHRDMKPSNIMIRNDERICILDFGIAKDMGSNSGGTLVGTVLGSDGYMSPEQANGFTIDHRADIYALGCVFYFMLTAHHAYNTLESDFAMLDTIANTPFPKLSKYSKKAFPPRLQEILDHATDKNMMRRYQSCREFRKDLEAFLPSSSGAHTVISTSKREEIFITVGREGCDIIIDDPMMKVSRSHIDITYRQFTGGRFYVIADHSSNGTMVNGRRLSRGDSENIPANGPDPQVYLACDGNYPLDWNEVKRLIAEKLNALSGNDAEDVSGQTLYKDNPQVFIPQNPVQPFTVPNKKTERKPEVSFIDAIKLFFTRAFDFKGRSRRKEYWYAYLFQSLFVLLVSIISLFIWIIGGNFMEALGLFSTVTGIYNFLVLIPWLSLNVRRLHDIGMNWTLLLLWLLLLVYLIPYIGFIIGPFIAIGLLIVWIVFWTKDSQPTENRWGPCPK